MFCIFVIFIDFKNDLKLRFYNNENLIQKIALLKSFTKIFQISLLWNHRKKNHSQTLTQDEADVEALGCSQDQVNSIIWKHDGNEYLPEFSNDLAHYVKNYYAQINSKLNDFFLTRSCEYGSVPYRDRLPIINSLQKYDRDFAKNENLSIESYKEGMKMKILHWERYLIFRIQ